SRGAQNFGDRHHAVVHHCVIAGLSHMLGRDRLGHVAEPAPVVHYPCLQHRARRRAGARDVEIRKSHACAGERVDVGRRIACPERADVGKAPVVRDEEDDVGMTRRRRSGGGGKRRDKKRNAQCQCCRPPRAPPPVHPPCERRRHDPISPTIYWHRICQYILKSIAPWQEGRFRALRLRMGNEGGDMSDWDRWIGRSFEQRDLLTPAALARFRATIDSAETGETAAQAIHWCLCLPDAPTAVLGADGHPLRVDTEDSFMPPIALPRRMWAASDIHFLAPIRAGASIIRRSTIAAIREKTGSSGELVFVEVDHDTLADGVTAVRERQ